MIKKNKKSYCQILEWDDNGVPIVWIPVTYNPDLKQNAKKPSPDIVKDRVKRTP